MGPCCAAGTTSHLRNALCLQRLATVWVSSIGKLQCPMHTHSKSHTRKRPVGGCGSRGHGSEQLQQQVRNCGRECHARALRAGHATHAGNFPWKPIVTSWPCTPHNIHGAVRHIQACSRTIAELQQPSGLLPRQCPMHQPLSNVANAQKWPLLQAPQRHARVTMR